MRISFLSGCLALLLPGSLAAQGAEWIRGNYLKREVMIPMRDGVRLHTAIYAPKAEGAHPFLLHRTPYSSAPYGPDAYPDQLGPSEAYAKEGFIFVTQDVRGRFMSEGDFVHMTPHRPEKYGPYDIDESSDTYDTLSWLLAHQLPNNGRAGQWGISYPGFYTAAGMIDAHPALKAVSPQAPIVDWFAGDDFHRNGALWLPHLFNFIALFDLPRPVPTASYPPVLPHGTRDGYRFFMENSPLSRLDERFLHGQIPLWTATMAHGTKDAFWASRELRPHLKAVKPAVLVVGGWFDAENLFGALQTYKTLERQSVGTDLHLAMGPWSHGGWGRSPGERIGDVVFGSKTSEHFQETILLPFFLHHLKGAPDPGLPRAAVFETGKNQWRSFEAWPPKAARGLDLYPGPAGSLTFEAPRAKGYEEWVSDPARPVPFWNGIDIGMPKDYMAADQRFAATRPDVAVFRTDVLDADLTLAGPVEARLQVSTTGTDSDWVVKLIDVYPDDFPDPDGGPADGRSFLEDHTRMGGFQQLVRGEAMRGKFRNSFAAPQPFVPGRATAVDFSLNDVCHTFRKGHRIMVQIQCSWFPLMDRNPQVFTDIYAAKESDFRKATQRLHFGPGGSKVILPVLKTAP
jgi:putative CocE/NonD family hydrolase